MRWSNAIRRGLRANVMWAGSLNHQARVSSGSQFGLNDCMKIDGGYDYMMDFVCFTSYVDLVFSISFQFFIPFHGGIMGMKKSIARFEMADVCLL